MSHTGRIPCPPPVYAADTRLAGLRTAEFLLVASLRLFAAERGGDAGTGADWRGGFRAAGIAAKAAPAFEAMVSIVAAASSRPLDIHEIRCPVLGIDEARLLQGVSLLQAERFAGARGLLAAWLPPAAQRLAIPPALALARAMTEGGLCVPLRHSEAASFPFARRAQAQPGLLLVQ